MAAFTKQRLAATPGRNRVSSSALWISVSSRGAMDEFVRASQGPIVSSEMTSLPTRRQLHRRPVAAPRRSSCRKPASSRHRASADICERSRTAGRSIRRSTRRLLQNIRQPRLGAGAVLDPLMTLQAGLRGHRCRTDHLLSGTAPQRVKCSSPCGSIAADHEHLILLPHRPRAMAEIRRVVSVRLFVAAFRLFWLGRRKPVPSPRQDEARVHPLVCADARRLQHRATARHGANPEMHTTSKPEQYGNK